MAVAALPLLGACTSSPPAASRAISGQAMLSRFDRADALAATGQKDPSPEHMDAVRQALALPQTVALPGRTVRVAKDPYLEQLNGKHAPEFGAARSRIGALRSSLTEALATRPPDEAAIQTALDAAYRGIQRQHPGLAARALDALAGLISAAVRNLVQFSGWRTILEWAVVAAIAFLLIRQLARGRLVPDRTIDEGRTERRRRSERVDWVGEAEAAAARGDVEAAVRAFYRGLLSVLAARGLIRDDPALTAGEARTAVGSVRPTLYPAVAEATGAFERVVYGKSPGDMHDVEALRRAERAARAA
jgi:hypothetical protein